MDASATLGNAELCRGHHVESWPAAWLPASVDGVNMFPLFAAAAAVVPAVYVLRMIVRREFNIILRWPLLLITGVLLWTTMMYFIWPAALEGIEWARTARRYPALLFVLMLCIAAAAGRALRPLKNILYRRVD